MFHVWLKDILIFLLSLWMYWQHITVHKLYLRNQILPAEFLHRLLYYFPDNVQVQTMYCHYHHVFHNYPALLRKDFIVNIRCLKILFIRLAVIQCPYSTEYIITPVIDPPRNVIHIKSAHSIKILRYDLNRAIERHLILQLHTLINRKTCHFTQLVIHMCSQWTYPVWAI